LDLLARLPAGVDPRSHELLLQTALGPLLMVAKGFAAPELAACQKRARALCQELGASEHLVQALKGLCVVAVARADYEAAAHLADQCHALAETLADPPLLMRAEMLRGLSAYYLGHLAEARSRFLGALAHSDPNQRRASGPVPIPEVTTLSALSHAMWLMGDPDAALEHARAALGIATEIDHRDSLLWATHFTCELHLFRGEIEEARRLGTATAELARASEHAQLIAWAQIFDGWRRARSGDGSAVGAIRDGLAMYAVTSVETGLSQLAVLVAEAFLALGLDADVRATLEPAIARSERCSERFFAPELHRLLGEVELRANGNGAAAESAFQRALASARHTGARSLELRALTSLAGVPGTAAARRRVLKELSRVHAAFTEGLDTADLRRAREVLAAAKA
jgi:hypothetical protein